jgi:indole-3-glycerol phosphate synthase
MHNPPDILKKIIERKKQHVAEKKQNLSLQQIKQKISHANVPRKFVAAIRQKIANNEIAIIAEIKKASPSAGIIREDFNPVELARDYAANGATCLSVLTDAEFFQGADEYLQAVRDACSLPVLRKDFIIDSYQIYESRLLGADCILLIVAALTDKQLQEFTQLAQELSMDVLVEVHDAAELERALSLNIALLGINNRNLRTFVTSLDTTVQLVDKVPKDKIVVAESGINSRENLDFLRKYNVNVFLIGETFMRAKSPGKKLAELIAVK